MFKILGRLNIKNRSNFLKGSSQQTKTQGEPFFFNCDQSSKYKFFKVTLKNFTKCDSIHSKVGSKERQVNTEKKFGLRQRDILKCWWSN